jgi:hypothetical protein
MLPYIFRHSDPSFQLGYEAMSRRFEMQYSRRFCQRIADTAIQNSTESAPNATDSARDSEWKIWVKRNATQY